MVIYRTGEKRIKAFWKYVQKRDTRDCWLWTGCLVGGYGFFLYDTQNRAHRVAWILANGAIPDGLCVCHKCDVPHCVNPAHLFLGTHRDNMLDRKAKKPRRTRARDNRSPQSTRMRRYYADNPDHVLRGASANPSRLTETQAMLALTSAIPSRALARRFGVSPAAIFSIRSRRTWKHLGVPR